MTCVSFVRSGPLNSCFVCWSANVDRRHEPPAAGDMDRREVQGTRRLDARFARPHDRDVSDLPLYDLAAAKSGLRPFEPCRPQRSGGQGCRRMRHREAARSVLDGRVSEGHSDHRSEGGPRVPEYH